MNERFRSPGKPGRFLSPEDLDLWRRVTRTIMPRSAQLNEPALESLDNDTVGSRSTFSARVGQVVSKEIRVTEPNLRDKVALPIVGLDNRQKRKISRGQIAIDSAIDLHGLTQHEAFTKLRRFLRVAQSRNARIVLVITGKGDRRPFTMRGAPTETAGVLRRMVPQWLGASDLRNIVLGFEEAISTHGGSGALYVRLRRQKT